MGYRWAARDPSVFGAALLAGNVMVALVAFPLGWPIIGATPTDWAIVAFLGVFQIALSRTRCSRSVCERCRRSRRRC